MMELKVFDNFEQAMQFYVSMGDKLEPEMAMALNQAAQSVKSGVNKHIVSRKGISRDEVKDWTFRKARPGDLESLAIISGKRLGLEKFNPDPKKPMEGRTTGGVTVNIMGKRVPIRHAFVHDLWSKKYRDLVGGGGDFFVMLRKKGARPKQSYVMQGNEKKRLIGRFPMFRLTAVSVPQIADDDDSVEIAIRSAGRRFLSQFDHLVDRLMKEYQ